MPDSRSIPAARIARGAAVGLVAGIVASFAMDRFQAVAQSFSDGTKGEPATERAADRLARDVTGEPLADDQKALGGQAVHYAVGAALGIAYGVAAEVAPGVATGGGTAFAVATWALLDETAVPATGLGDAPWKASPGSQAFGLASHIVFGATTELVRRLALVATSRDADDHRSTQ